MHFAVIGTDMQGNRQCFEGGDRGVKSMTYTDCTNFPRVYACEKFPASSKAACENEFLAYTREQMVLSL